MVSRNLRTPGNGSEVPNGIQEWESINKYQLWGYRRYRRDDPLIDEDAAGLIGIPPTAAALSLRLDIARKFCVLHLFITGGSKDTIEIDRGSVSFRRLKPGVWEGSNDSANRAALGIKPVRRFIAYGAPGTESIFPY
jgi:hypothetical protein